MILKLQLAPNWAESTSTPSPKQLPDSFGFIQKNTHAALQHPWVSKTSPTLLVSCGIQAGNLENTSSLRSAHSDMFNRPSERITHMPANGISGNSSSSQVPVWEGKFVIRSQMGTNWNSSDVPWNHQLADFSTDGRAFRGSRTQSFRPVTYGERKRPFFRPKIDGNDSTKSENKACYSTLICIYIYICVHISPPWNYSDVAPENQWMKDHSFVLGGRDLVSGVSTCCLR